MPGVLISMLDLDYSRHMSKKIDIFEEI